MNPATVTTLQVGLWFLTFFGGFYSGIAPPDNSLKFWPSHGSLLALLGFIIYMHVGSRLQKSIIGIAIALALIGPIFYVWRYQDLTVTYASSRVICGTELTPRASEYKSQMGISNAQLLFDFAGVTTDVWTESSITRARLILGLSYSAGLSFLALASLIMFQMSKRPASHLRVEFRSNIDVDKQNSEGELTSIFPDQDRQTGQTTNETEQRSDVGGVTTPIEVFFSYAHEDEAIREEIAKHLKLLERQKVIRAWHDREIGPGSKWKGVIDERLKSAHIILLLISADFLASDYCYNIEMETALQLDEQRKARVIPIIVRDCDWQSAPFGHLQALPKDAKPIKRWSDRDAALKDVALGIKKAIKEFHLRQ